MAGHQLIDDHLTACPAAINRPVHEYRLDHDPALVELARIVHAADIADNVGAHPFGATVRALCEAGAAVEPDDQRLLERASFVYDVLYANCQQVTAGQGTTRNRIVL